MPDVTWLRSSFCSQDSCVEVAHLPDGRVAVRHRLGPMAAPGPPQVYTRAEWDAFTAGVRAGEFDPTGGGT